MKIRTLIFTLLVVALCVPATYADSLDDQLEQRKHEQPHRKKIINTLIEEGYIQQIKVPANHPHMYVEKKFYTLSYDNKEVFSNLVWTYYITKNRKSNILVIKDGYTGKEIGQHSEYGFKYNP